MVPAVRLFGDDDFGEELEGDGEGPIGGDGGCLGEIGKRQMYVPPPDLVAGGGVEGYEGSVRSDVEAAARKDGAARDFSFPRRGSTV